MTRLDMSRYLAIVLGLALIVAAACGDNEVPEPANNEAPAGSSPTEVATPDDGTPLVISAPVEGESVPVPFSVVGSVYELHGPITLQVLDEATGELLCERRVQASGDSARMHWFGYMSYTPAGSDTGQPITLRVFDIGQDGSEDHLVTRQLVASTALPHVIIEEPACGAETSRGGGLTVTGTAIAPEGSVNIEIRDGHLAGDTVLFQDVMADASAPDRGRWTAEIDLTDLEIGQYELVAYTRVDGTGVPDSVFSLPIFVVP